MSTAKPTWNGAQTYAQVAALIMVELEPVRASIESDLRANLHKKTGEMAAMSFAELDNRTTAIDLNIGSNSDHTYFHEVAPNNYPPHPQIRQIADSNIIFVQSAVKRAVT